MEASKEGVSGERERDGLVEVTLKYGTVIGNRSISGCDPIDLYVCIYNKHTCRCFLHD